LPSIYVSGMGGKSKPASTHWNLRDGCELPESSDWGPVVSGLSRGFR
jgi:hypothetical protein